MRMVMTLLEKNSAPWSYLKPPYEYRCTTLRHTHSTYLNVRGGPKNIQNACSDVVCVQSRTQFQIFFRSHFGLHHSRTETLQQEEC